MIGTSSQFGRGGGHGGEQFYDPYGEGRHSNFSRRPRNGFLQGKYHHHANSNSSNNGNNKQQQVVDEDGCCRRVASASPSSLVSASGRKMASCNLDRFLESTTPMVPLQHLPKTITKGWRASYEAECMPFFSLGDLWESFNEWSAYGAGIPIVLNGSDTVVQYYVPSLSAIQLYTQNSRLIVGTRRPGDESDGDTSSEASSDVEVERDLKYGDCASQGGFSSDDGEASNRPCFQYFERAVPYSREPLSDKIASLARNFPQLNSLRSIDLLSSSWLSVAWYPIYRIPTGPTLRDLAASFLTFHSLSLSTPLKDGSNSQIRVGERSVPCNHVIKSGKLALSVFGLASYKFQGTVWSSTGSSCKRQRHDSLLQTADEWLRSRQVKHPDYEFFLSHGSSYRG